MIFVKVKTDSNIGVILLQNIIQRLESSITVVNKNIGDENNLFDNPITNFSVFLMMNIL